MAVIQDGEVLAAPFATLSPVYSNGECGLLGVAFDPEYMTNLVVYFFISETRPALPRGSDETRIGPSPMTDGVYLQVVLATFAFCLMFFSHISVMPLTVIASAGYPAWDYGDRKSTRLNSRH